MPTTELPVELWEKIVGNLPLPLPKLVPLIVFKRRKQQGPACYDLHVSRAVSTEERDLIAGAWAPHNEWVDAETHWTKSAYWQHAMDNICIRAEFLGYVYCSDEEKRSVNLPGPPPYTRRMLKQR